MPENQNASFKLHASDDDTSLTNMTFGFDATRADGGNAGGRFAIEKINGVSYLKLVQPLDYEAAPKDDQGRAYYTVYVKAGDGTSWSQPRAMTVFVTDENEAPSDIAFSNARTLRAGTTMAGADVVAAGWDDPDGPASGFRTNVFAFRVGNDLVENDGKFRIDPTTGQVTTTGDILDADIGTKTLTIVARDIGDPALLREESHRVAIVAANAGPAVEFDPGSVTVEKEEGTGAGTTAYTFTIRRDTTQGTSTVHWTLDHDTTNAVDFDGLTSGDVTFQQGQDSREVVVHVRMDNDVEPSEAFSITLTATPADNAAIGTNGTATGIITNDDEIPAPPFHLPPIPLTSLRATFGSI